MEQRAGKLHPRPRRPSHHPLEHCQEIHHHQLGAHTPAPVMPCWQVSRDQTTLHSPGQALDNPTAQLTCYKTYMHF